MSLKKSVFINIIFLFFSPNAFAEDLNALDRKFTTVESRAIEISRITDIRKAKIILEIEEESRKMNSRCRPVDKELTKYSCRPYQDSRIRTIFEEPYGYDCVAVKAPNPDWGEYDLCMLINKNDARYIEYLKKQIPYLDSYELDLREKTGSMSEAEFGGLREQNLRWAGLLK